VQQLQQPFQQQQRLSLLLLQVMRHLLLVPWMLPGA
jgi:hypothetical protein